MIKQKKIEKFKKIIFYLYGLLCPMPDSKQIRVLHKRLASAQLLIKPKYKCENAVIAVQCVENAIFSVLFAALALDLKQLTGCRAALLQVYGINRAIGVDWKARILRSWPISVIKNRQWANLNSKIIGSVAYRSNSLSNPLGDLLDWFHANTLWRSLQSELDISDLLVHDIVIGDLVIDTYLRFRPSPRFDITDPFVKKILWQCLRDIRHAKQWFNRVRPKLYISSYSTYIEHGIAVRIALSFDVAVYVYGNLNVFGKRLSKEYFYHTSETGNYKRLFNTLHDQDKCLEEAEVNLNARLAGGIDSATAYMKISAYEISDEVVPDVSGSVVIFMHDFYDSPHTYPNLIFPDFWTWIDFTICVLKDAGIDFWIKPHPNQIPLNSQVYKDLLDAHPDIRILSSRVTNKQLAEAGILCGVTVYGTVAHELAYFGIPTIACAKHSHHAFDFCRTAYRVSDYENMLRTPNQCLISRFAMKRDALAFYYMHNLYGSREMLDMRNHFIEFWKVGNSADANTEDLWVNLEKLRGHPGWLSHIETLTKEITDP